MPRFPVSIVSFRLSLVLAASCSLSSLHAAGKPNILFLFADDQCFETIHALNNPEVKTPHLDSLTRRGMVFERAYNMGSWSGAVCVASRTMLNSGRFVWKANAIYATSDKEREAGRWWSEYMKGAGYETYMTGKWHCRASAEKSFDHAEHVRGGMPKQTPEGYNRPLPGVPDPWSPYDKKFGGFWEGGKHWSEVVAEDAIGFLADARQRDKPFFMYIAFNAVHDPRQAPKEYVDQYPADQVKVPENFLPEYPYKDAIALGVNQRDESLAPFPRTEHAVQVNRGEYYAILTHMDVQIGRILAALEASGQADNTWIVFTADHGLAVGQHGLMGKQNMYEHSTHVPFFVIGPGVKAGSRFSDPIYLQDIMPTTLELAGVKKPGHVDFNSLLPILHGQRKEGFYDAVYGGYLQVQRSVTQGRHKLILYPTIAKARLFDLKQDPKEMKDLADDSKHTALKKRLFAKLLELQRETGDTLDLRSRYPGLL